jgi:hypothetical protein
MSRSAATWRTPGTRPPAARQVVDFGAAADQFPGRRHGRRCPSRRRRVRQYSGFLPCRRSTVATRAPEAGVSLLIDQDSEASATSRNLTIAFIALPSDRAASGTRVDDRLRFDPSGDDLLDGKLAARNHPDHSRPHCDLVAPGRLDRDVLVSQIAGRRPPSYHAAGLHDGAAIARGLDANIQAHCDSGALDRGVDSNPSSVLARIWSMTLPAFGSSTAVAAPWLSIRRRRLAFGSPAKIFDAPIALQINITIARSHQRLSRAPCFRLRPSHGRRHRARQRSVRP